MFSGSIIECPTPAHALETGPRQGAIASAALRVFRALPNFGARGRIARPREET